LYFTSRDLAYLYYNVVFSIVAVLHVSLLLGTFVINFPKIFLF